MTRARCGFALPAVLVLLALVSAAAAGLLSIASRRSLDALDTTRSVRVRSAAQAGVREALAVWDADSMRAMAVGTVGQLLLPGAGVPGVTLQAEAERLDARRYLVRVGARHSAGVLGTASAAAVALVTTVPIDSIWRDFHAALAAAGAVDLAAGAVVSGLDSGIPAGWSAADCPPGLSAFVAALLGGLDRPGVALPATGAAVSATGATVAGLPPVWPGAPGTDTADFLRLGPLTLSDVAVAADRTETGSLRLAPASAGGACDRNAPGNWGAPGNPADPCFDWIPLVFADSDIEVAAGSGQGILVVRGTVTFRSGTSFTGLVLATGRIELEGARITGAARAAAGARIDGALESSACAVGRVLWRTPALRRPYRFGDRLWLPAF